MDYLFFSSLGACEVTSVVVSYDIACQWSKLLWDRMELYGRNLPPNIDKSKDIVFLVPKFHLPAHIESCQTTYSFNLTPFVGRTDGEAPERGWSHINPIATSTREMGPGSRRDTLDDHFSDWNWKKTVGMGMCNHHLTRETVVTMKPISGPLLLRRIKAAVDERSEQQWAFDQLTLSLPEEELRKWTELVELWEADSSNKNPYEVTVKSAVLICYV
jgi:Kyakuja-Dileera-Zisupton transposase